jgi:hypothetical protein
MIVIKCVEEELVSAHCQVTGRSPGFGNRMSSFERNLALYFARRRGVLTSAR